jgi:hypothetical protein
MFMYLGGSPKGTEKCTLMSGRELECFYGDVIADTTTYEDGITPESRKRISRDLSSWSITDQQLPPNVALPKNRIARTFYVFSYIYRPKIADSIFKKADRKYISCLVHENNRQKLHFPEIEGVQMVTPDVKGDDDYYYYTCPLTSLDHKYAVVKRMRPQQWIETTKGYTYNLQLLYYKQVNGKWICIYQSGFWY